MYEMSEKEGVTIKERIMGSAAFRSFIIFSIFRAIYGLGILIVTFFLATNDGTPSWFPILFLLSSMVISRRIFSAIKSKWPQLF
tara:strand:- start:649 stop:900 length:252 start_codon:yes stop_codon:yes gene_type:complete